MMQKSTSIVKLKDKKKAKGERRLVVDGETWGWKIGRGITVIVSPDRKRTVVNLPEDHGRITPQMVVNYIRENLQCLSSQK